MMRRWMLLVCLSLVFVSAASFPSHAQAGSEIFPYGRPTKLSENRVDFHCVGNNILPLINNRGDVTWYCQKYGPEHWVFLRRHDGRFLRGRQHLRVDALWV